MAISAETISGLALFLLAAGLVLHRSSGAREFAPIDIAVLSMGVVYGLVFPFVTGAARLEPYAGARFIIEAESYAYMHSFVAALAIVGLLIGWTLSWGETVTLHRRLFSELKPGSLMLSLYGMLALALVSQYLYTKDYGGFLGYFDYNALVRSGRFDLFERSSFSFLKPFGDFAPLACYGFWGMLLSGKRSPLYLFGFVLALLMSSYVLYASGGRVAMVSFAAVLLISLIIETRRRTLIWFVSILGFFGTGIGSLYVLSNVLGIRGADSLSLYIVREVSFPFVSFFAELSLGDKFLLFKEVLLSPGYFAPSSLTKDWLVAASSVNTEIIMGAAKGVEGVSAAIPVDLITFGLMQLHIPGVFLAALLFGALLRLFCALTLSFRFKGLQMVFYAYIVVKVATFSLFYGYPAHFIATHFALIVAAIWMVLWVTVLRPALRGPVLWAPRLSAPAGRDQNLERISSIR